MEASYAAARRFATNFVAYGRVAPRRPPGYAAAMPAAPPRARAKRPTPLPGGRVRGSTTGRPIMALLDLLGRRWTQRIVWELRGAALTFRALRAACGGISPSTLNARLAELRDAGLVETAEDGYRLTADGRALLRHLEPLHEWAERWARRLKAATG